MHQIGVEWSSNIIKNKGLAQGDEFRIERHDGSVVRGCVPADMSGVEITLNDKAKRTVKERSVQN